MAVVGQLGDKRLCKCFLAFTRDGVGCRKVIIHTFGLPIVIVACLDNHNLLVGITTLQLGEHGVESLQCSMVVGIIAQADDVVIHAIALDFIVKTVEDGGLGHSFRMDDNLRIRTFFMASLDGVLQ